MIRKRYRKASSMLKIILQLHQFYGEQNQRIFYAEQAEIKQSIDFVSFSRVLKSGQLALAQQMISDFFEQFQQAVMSPEDIRHFSFYYLWISIVS